MKIINKNLQEKIIKIAMNILDNEEAIYLAFNSGFVDELIILIKRIPIENIPSDLISVFENICEKGSSE